MSRSVLDNLAETKKLPLGHIDRKKAQEAVDKVYNRCHEIACKWHKRFGNKVPRFDTAQQALAFCNRLCDELGENKVKAIVVDAETVGHAGACYNYQKKTIFFPYAYFSFTTLIHELTHHFKASGHDDKFCEILDFIFRTVYIMVTGKQPHDDW